MMPHDTQTNDRQYGEETPAFLLPASLLRTFVKHRLLIASVWLACTLSAIGIVRSLPATYLSEAVILIDSQAIAEQLVTPTLTSGMQDRMATIQEQILSSASLAKIIERFGLYRVDGSRSPKGNSLESMRRDIRFTTERLEGAGGSRQPVALRIGYSGPDPVVVAQVADCLMSSYIEQDGSMRAGRAVRTSEFLYGQLSDARSALESLEASLTSYKVRHSGDLPQQRDNLASSLSRLQVQLEANRDAVNRAQQSKIVLASSVSIAESHLAEQLRAAGAGSGKVAAGPESLVPARLATLQAELDKLRARFSERYPGVVRLQAEIEAIQRARDDQSMADSAAAPKAPSATVESPEVNRARQQLTALEGQVAALNREVSDRRADEVRILGELEALQKRMDVIPIREQEMAQMTRDYEMAKDRYKSLLEKKTMADMSVDLENRQRSDRLVVLERAAVPSKPIKPNRAFLCGLGTGAGLLLGVIAAFLVEWRRNVFLGEWELPAGTPVLARLPELRAPAGD